jgi:hypothetical protein
VNIVEEEQAMDFFHGFDNGRYSVFKTNMLNGWAGGAFDIPDTVNKIFRIALTRVKPVPHREGGSAVSYVMLEDDVRSKKQEKKLNQEQAAKRQQ